jgi:hypothetical protein
MRNCRSVILGENLAASHAAEPLQAVAVFPEALGFRVTGRAFHLIAVLVLACCSMPQ